MIDSLQHKNQWSELEDFCLHSNSLLYGPGVTKLTRGVLKNWIFYRKASLWHSSRKIYGIRKPTVTSEGIIPAELSWIIANLYVTPLPSITPIVYASECVGS